MTDDAAVPELRASDADRERVAEILRDALAEGRLDMAEFEERLEATYQARTYGELAPITRDLPVGQVAHPAVSLVKEPQDGGDWAGRIVGGEGSSSWAVAVMSGFERKGRWTVPRRFNCFAVMGGGELDLRDANFADRQVEINCVTIMGGFDHTEEGVPPAPGAPRVIVTGFALMGGVGVERKLTREERRRLKEERRQERLERRSGRALDEGLGAPTRMLEEHREFRRELREERRERQRERHEERRERRRRDEY